MKAEIDLHTHTIVSGHAYCTLAENVKAASEKGLKIIGITDHAPAMAGSSQKSNFINPMCVPKTLFGVNVIMGVELNIVDYDGNIDLPEDILKIQDIAIASLHPPCIKFGAIDENTSAILKAMDNKYINIIGHPGDPRYPLDFESVVDKSIDTNTLLEVNNASLTPDSFRKGSSENIIKMLKMLKKRSFPVIMGSDAHFFDKVGCFEYAEKIIEEVDFPKELVLNYSVKAFKDFFQK